MWHTSSGDRILAGTEAQLFKACVLGMVELIKEEMSGFGEQWEYGIRLYDELEPSQRLALLEHVTTCLLEKSLAQPELTAVNEAAIGAAFAHAGVELDWEIDGFPPGTSMRRLVRRAYMETRGSDEPLDEDDWGPPEPDAVDREEWGFVIEMLTDRILWDRDYELLDSFLDAPPENGEILKSFMGIEANYFAVPSPDVGGGADSDAVLARLEQLCSSDGQTP